MLAVRIVILKPHLGEIFGKFSKKEGCVVIAILVIAGLVCTSALC